MTGSPLGRDAEGSDDGPLHTVTLLNLPVQLLLDERDRHDSLLRELALLALSHDGDGPRPPRLVELSRRLAARHDAADPRPDEEVDDAARRGLTSLDVTHQLSATTIDAAGHLEALMAEADAYCRSEQLLTLPRSALQVRVSTWYLDELRRQVDGEPPRPWDGPLDG